VSQAERLAISENLAGQCGALGVDERGALERRGADERLEGGRRRVGVDVDEHRVDGLAAMGITGANAGDRRHHRNDGDERQA
jgi:hypothetical protein